MQKPFKSYLGGKESSGVYQSIINCIPKHKTLIIPFLGNCAITRYIKKSDRTILIDKNYQVIQSWLNYLSNQLKNNPNQKIFLLTTDGIDYLEKINPGIETVIYCDPPYPISTRSSKTSRYKCDLTDDDHRRLINRIRKMNCRILISTYKNPIYHSSLIDWNKIEIQSQTRKGKRIELLYFNFDLDQIELHDYSYLGKNFRDRERIKKKINRTSNKLMALKRFECLAIVEKINQELINRYHITINDDPS